MGRLLILNFGTFTETNRFKSAAFKHKFLDTDVMFNVSAGDLLQPDKGLDKVMKPNLEAVFTFARMKPATWKSKLPNGDKYQAAFQTWMKNILDKSVDCLYLTGHHWTSSGKFYLSKGESTDEFTAKGEKGKNKLWLGITRHWIELDAANLQSNCKLILGFGCNVATGSASLLYQNIFSSGGNWPVVGGWNQTISVPGWNQTSVGERFFEYLVQYAQSNSGVSANDRLQWFYDNQPLELVRAWG